MDQQTQELFQREYERTERALRREGFATVSMEVVDEGDWLWSLVATSRDGIPDIAIWFGHWFPSDVERPFFWTGFQGQASDIKKMSVQCFEEGLAIADRRFLDYNALDYSVAKRGIVCEKDWIRYYMGMYRFTDEGEKLSVDASSLAQLLNHAVDCMYLAKDRSSTYAGGTEKEALILARRGQGQFRLQTQS